VRSIAILILALSYAGAYGQGCSDAGVCTAGPIGDITTGMDSTAAAMGPKHSARVTFSYGVGERGVVILQAVPQIDLKLSERWALQMKMPYISASGDLGANSGIGDPVISGSYRIHSTATSRIDGTLGMRLPVNDANALEDGKPLPMPYQTSLGTTDLLAGLSYRTGRWQAAIAYQHVLHHGNHNGFTHARWMDDMRALGYFESHQLRRANDGVVRLQYRIPVGRLDLQPGILAIYHLAPDRMLEPPLDPAGSPQIPGHVAVEGSQGLTLNLTLDARYRLSDHWSLLFAYGSPVITREVRPDGLTRFQVINIALLHHFGRGL
jgi:hypothetical protein